MLSLTLRFCCLTFFPIFSFLLRLTQNPSDMVYRVVELRVLSNWGHVEYTCLYRFRVHGKIATT